MPGIHAAMVITNAHAHASLITDGACMIQSEFSCFCFSSSVNLLLSLWTDGEFCGPGLTGFSTCQVHAVMLCIYLHYVGPVREQTMVVNLPAQQVRSSPPRKYPNGFAVGLKSASLSETSQQLLGGLSLTLHLVPTFL